MTTCTVTNSSAIRCDNGCCGTADNRTCCDFTLSESVVIVICVVGALVVVAIVVALILCLTSKQKNRVTRIRPRQRRRMLDNEPRARRVDIPKPPPYSEAPPQYDAIPFSEESRSTEPILPGYRTPNTRITRGQRSSRQQSPPSERRHTNAGQQDDAPPSYISVIHMEQNNYQYNRHGTPEPGTSGMGRISRNETADISMIDRTRHGSPHPSLASGRISTSMFNSSNANGRLHKTASERSRRRLGIRSNNSVTPVTIREITVHSHTTHNPNTGNDIRAGKEDHTPKQHAFSSKIPRPSKRRRVETESQNVKNANSAMSNTGLLPGALEDTNYIDQSPPPMNPAAAARSAQRHTVLHRLQQRRNLVSPTAVQ